MPEAPARPIADAVVVAAGSSRRMGGTDKLAWPDRGPATPALDPGGARASASVDRLILVIGPRTRWTRSTRIHSPAASRTPWSPAARRGSSRSPPASCTRLTDPGGRDRPVLVHDGARPLVPRRWWPRSPMPPSRWAPRCRCWRWRTRSNGSSAGSSSRRWTVRHSRPPQTPQGARRTSCWRLGGLPAGRPPRVHGRGRPARGLYHSGLCDPRRTGEPQGDAARRSPTRRAGAGARVGADRLRPRQPSLRARDRSPARRDRDRGCAETRRALGR